MSLQTDRQINTVMHNNIQVRFFITAFIMKSVINFYKNETSSTNKMYCIIRPLDFEISHLCLLFFVVVSLTMTVQKSRTLIFGSALIVLQAFWWHFSNKTLRLSPQELICDTRVASCVIWPFLHQAIVTPSHVIFQRKNLPFLTLEGAQVWS